MKKNINFLFLLILFFSIKLLGQSYNKQNTYLDAQKLADIKKTIPISSKNDTIYEISSYLNAFRQIVYKYGSDEELLTNPFIKDYLLGVYPPLTSSPDQIIKDVNGSKSKPTKVFSVTKQYQADESVATSLEAVNFQASAINGLANFMAGRFKQEVLQVAIDQLFKQIKTEHDSEFINAIFPKTFKHISFLYGNGSSAYYTADLILLRQTAQIDIEQLPYNLIRNSNNLLPGLIAKPEIRDMLTLGTYIVEYSKQGQPLDKLLTILANEKYPSESAVCKMLNIADLISQALLSEQTIGNNDGWINPMSVLPAMSNSTKDLEVRYFYGLIYQQLINIPELRTYLLSDNTDNIQHIASKIQNLIHFVSKLNSVYNYVQSKKFNLKSSEEIITYIKDVNQSICQFANVLKDIPEINYSLRFDDSILNSSTRYISLIEALIREDYQKVIPLLLIEFGDYMHGSGEAIRTATFISQLATIENAGDMETLLNSYALPIGSSSIKRHSRFNISLNGYVGLTGGWETAFGSLKNQTKLNVGLAAPIGVSATICNGRLTPFVSLIDLGSIVNERLNNDTTSYAGLKFEQFFTPGIGLFYNFRKLPITLGLHYYYIPNLRTIKYESGTVVITETNRSVSRLNFSLLVDIPFFTLYNIRK